jgi:signal transduction histidine kinase
LLDVSPIEAGQWKLERERLSLRKLVKDVVDEFQLVSPEHRLVLEQEGDELTVEADPARLKQVVTNLVDNAIKYSPGGGLVHVRLARHDAEASLTVSDQGIGIPAEQQAELFERFFRARNAPARQFGGLGLGLYISRCIVEAHQGQIGVKSQQGQGSTFFVRLPLVAQACRAVLPSAAELAAMERNGP